MEGKMAESRCKHCGGCSRFCQGTDRTSHRFPSRLAIDDMLCQFTVKNFKSISEKVTFDMQAAVISEHEDRIIKDKDGELFLPVSAIYGPNGGGKSNVLAALHTLAAKVLRPLYATGDNEGHPFQMKRLALKIKAFGFVHQRFEAN